METTSINWSPLWISLQTAITTIIIVFFLGTLTAWWVLQQKSEVVKIIADGIFTLPLVLPPTVVGFLLLYILGSNRLPEKCKNRQNFVKKNVKFLKSSSGKM